MSGICHEPDNPNIHVTGIVFVRGHPVETGCPKHFQPIPLPQMMFFTLHENRRSKNVE